MLRDTVARSGVKSVVSFVLRWNPLFENLKSLLATKTIGDLSYVEVDYWHGLGTWYTGWEWARTRKYGGSAMLVAGCHAVDAMRWFVDDEVAEVSAFANNKKGLYEYEPSVVAIMKFRGGAIGKTSTLIDCEMPYAFNIDLVGTDGALRDNRLWSKNSCPARPIGPCCRRSRPTREKSIIIRSMPRLIIWSTVSRTIASRTVTLQTPIIRTSCAWPLTGPSQKVVRPFPYPRRELRDQL